MESNFSFIGKPFFEVESQIKENYKNYRKIKPTSKYTEEFRPTRINVFVDDNDIIIRITYG